MLPRIKLRKLVFTVHAHAKMRQYGLSEARVRRVLHTPARIEEGIAEGTIAMMQPISNGKHELWVMIAEKPAERRVVSAWRYPGRTKPGEPLPPDVLRSLRSALR